MPQYLDGVLGWSWDFRSSKFHQLSHELSRDYLLYHVGNVSQVFCIQPLLERIECAKVRGRTVHFLYNSQSFIHQVKSHGGEMISVCSGSGETETGYHDRFVVSLVPDEEMTISGISNLDQKANSSMPGDPWTIRFVGQTLTEVLLTNSVTEHKLV